MLPSAIAALLGLTQPVPVQGVCMAGEANIHVPANDLTVQVVIEDGKPVSQGAMVRFDPQVSPFLMLIGYPEPGAKPDWVQVYYYYDAASPVGRDEVLRLTAPDGQHWEVKPRATGLGSRSGRKGLAADFVFLAPDQPNAELARMIAGSEAFDIERYKDGAVHSALRFHPLPRDMRTLLHQKAIDQASAALKPCAPATNPPQSAP